jgi:hypothetical protein
MATVSRAGGSYRGYCKVGLAVSIEISCRNGGRECAERVTTRRLKAPITVAQKHVSLDNRRRFPFMSLVCARAGLKRIGNEAPIETSE